MRPEDVPEEIVRAVADAFAKACREAKAPDGLPLLDSIEPLKSKADVEAWGITWPDCPFCRDEIDDDQTRIMGRLVAPFVLSAVWPLIAQAERERCAKVAEDIWASYRADADRADGAGDPELSMLALRSTTVARQITSNIRALPDGDPTWLAKELGAVKREVAGWTGALKQSYETLSRKGE